MLLMLRIEGGRRVRRLSGGGIVFSRPEVRGRGRYSWVGSVRGGAGKYEISETRLMVALSANCVSSSRAGVGAGIGAGLGACFMVFLFSDTRGDLFAGSDKRCIVSRRLSALTSIERVRLLSRPRLWLGRGFEGIDRDPRALIKTTVGRVPGSMIVTSLATWISASSTEKTDEGEAERDLELAGCGLGQTYTDGCKKVLDSSGGESDGGSSRISCSSGSKTYVSSSKVASLFLLIVAEETGRARLAVGGARICSSRSEYCEFSSALRSESKMPAREPTGEESRSWAPVSDSDTASSSDSYRS